LNSTILSLQIQDFIFTKLKSWIYQIHNKSAKIAIDRSPHPSYTFKQCLRQVWWQLSKKCDLLFVYKVFAIFGQCGLFFDHRWSILKLDLEIIKTNLQTIFQDIWITTVATREFTRFSIFISCDLVFHQRYPYSNSFKQLTRQTFWPSLMTYLFHQNRWELFLLLIQVYHVTKNFVLLHRKRYFLTV
jgi:hypothetical protein